MATDPYNNLGKLSAGDDQPLVLSTNGLNVLEINTGEFSDLVNFSQLTLDTFTTNLLGNPTPELCTGMISWISAEPGQAPVSLGLKGGNVNVTTSGKIDLTWALSLDPANVETTNISGNVIYDVDYILEYPGVSSNVSSLTYYLNIAYVNDSCLGNIANCNVSAPQKMYTQAIVMVVVQVLGQAYKPKQANIAQVTLAKYSNLAMCPQAVDKHGILVM